MPTTITLAAADGHTLNTYVAQPAGPPRGAVVVVQEIFGVNPHVRSVTDGYAADGDLAIAPALSDRVERGVELACRPEDIQRSFGEGDAPIPRVTVPAFQRAQASVGVHLYPAGHDGFNCNQRGSFDATSATLARERTLAFLRQHLG